MAGIGNELMIRFVAAAVCDRLFEEHKELLNLFTKFHKLTTRDEQASSEELAEHAVSVMTTLDESIRSLDNVDAFILYLHQVGQSHYKIPGFQKEYFWVCLNKTKIFFDFVRPIYLI
jgi:hemoglobin-like flavoprotein